jgi:hypothetical protein
MSSRPIPPWISSSTIGWCIAGLLIAACGLGGPSSLPRSGQVFLRSSGATPSDQAIANGGSVVFYAFDGSRHEIYSGPHPAHTGCPALNIGAVGPPADKTAGPLRTGVCQFHDDVSPDDARFQGTIRVE